jgi:predicted Zn-dependent protease
MVLSPDRKLEYKEAGFSHEGIGNLTEALDGIYGRKQLQVSIPEGPPEAIRRFGLAMQFMKKGLSERAEVLLTQLVQDHPGYRPAWVSLGYCRIELGKVDESRESFEQAHNLDAGNPDVAAGLAWISWKEGCLEKAAEWASLVGDDDPNSRLVDAIRKESLK